MTRPTYEQAQVLARARAGRDLHDGFSSGLRSAASVRRAFERLNADIRSCQQAGWLDAQRRLTLPGEAALARYERRGVDA